MVARDNAYLDFLMHPVLKSYWNRRVKTYRHVQRRKRKRLKTQAQSSYKQSLIMVTLWSEYDLITLKAKAKQKQNVEDGDIR